MTKTHWILVAAIVVSLAAGTYWLLTDANPQISDRPVAPSNDSERPGELLIPAPSQIGTTPPPRQPSENKKAQAEATPANPDVKMVDGIKMLRGRTIDGDEVWIPAAPEPAEPKTETEEEPEFLPAPE